MNDVMKLESKTADISVKAADGARLVLLAVEGEVYTLSPSEARNLAALLNRAADIHG